MRGEAVMRAIPTSAEIDRFLLGKTMVVRLSDMSADIGDLYVSLGIFRKRTDELLATARESTSRPGSVSETESDLESMDGFLNIANRALDRRRAAADRPAGHDWLPPEDLNPPHRDR